MKTDSQLAQADTAAPAQDQAPPMDAAIVPEDALIIVPVRNLVLFPGLVLPITIGREATVAALQQAARTGRQVGILLQRDPNTGEPGPDDLYRVGVAASILRYMTTPDGAHHVICQGEQRFLVDEFLPGYPFT